MFVNTAVLAMFSLLGTSAQAGFVRGSWDPAFGPAFPALGFGGTAEIFVPDACFTASLSNPAGTRIGDGAGCSLGGMFLVNARVTLYDLAAPSIVLETLFFAPPVPFPDPVLGVAMAFNADTGRNEVIGLDMDFVGPQFASLVIAGGPGSPFWLQFLSGFNSDGATSDTPGAYLVAGSCNLEFCAPSTDPAARSNAGVVTWVEIAAVPEPGSLALLFGALGASWLTRRRKAAA